jgi:hypothetical protein
MPALRPSTGLIFMLQSFRCIELPPQNVALDLAGFVPDAISNFGMKA